MNAKAKLREFEGLHELVDEVDEVEDSELEEDRGAMCLVFMTILVSGIAALGILLAIPQ